MDSSLIATVIIAVAVLAFAGWVEYHHRSTIFHRPDSAGELLTEVQTTATDLREIIAMAEQLVAAAEQLWTTGKIGKDDRFDWVFERLDELFPDIDRPTLTAMIEGAVFLIKQGVKVVTPAVLPAPNINISAVKRTGN